VLAPGLAAAPAPRVSRHRSCRLLQLLHTRQDLLLVVLFFLVLVAVHAACPLGRSSCSSIELHLRADRLALLGFDLPGTQPAPARPFTAALNNH
jgi:hypothetical protein